MYLARSSPVQLTLHVHESLPYRGNFAWRSFGISQRTISGRQEIAQLARRQFRLAQRLIGLPPHLREVVEQAHLALEALETGPDAATLASAPVLDLWQPVFTGPKLCLDGLVDGHSLLPAGRITTSPLIVLAPDLTWARTCKRYYRLGTSLADSLGAAFGQRLAVIPDASGGLAVTLDAVREHLAMLHDMIRTIARHG